MNLAFSMIIKYVSSSLQGVAYDRGTGCVYIADTGNNRVLKIDAETFRVTIVALSV